MSGRLSLARNPKYVRNGLKSYAHLLRKYNITPSMPGPFAMIESKAEHSTKHKLTTALHFKKHGAHQQTLVKKSSTGQEGTVPAEDIQNDSLYLAEVDIGTPAQKLMLDFDTGSADLWVWSTSLPKDTQAAASGHVIFDPSKSKTFKNSSGSTWKITYGDQSSASGTVGTDVVALGSVKITGQAIELAKELSTQFQQGSGDGLLGLAFDTINTVSPSPVKTPVDNMESEDAIPQQVFTAYLGSWRDADEADQGESFYTFGTIDQDALQGQTPVYAPVDSSNGFWEFASTSSQVNGQSVSIPNGTAIADTGTTLGLVDTATVKAIYAAIPGSKYDSTQQGYVYPSSVTVDQLPVVKLAVGDNFVEIQKEDLGFADAGNGMIYGSFQDRGNMNLSIYGDAVLKSIYAIFDQGNMQFGFTQRKETNQNISVPPADGSS
ncbi:aspergillopepsin-1 [Acrodontium crateriforme]|uniref:Aspergillopepsin-1 n=1 Tax=Acrodontium crateriforme TaxID=150365 RepID=A0AAQ3M447_9PEZI|nr:aspergillopepsin-1 [Acrodontium crateriforme]